MLRWLFSGPFKMISNYDRHMGVTLGVLHVVSVIDDYSDICCITNALCIRRLFDVDKYYNLYCMLKKITLVYMCYSDLL